MPNEEGKTNEAVTPEADAVDRNPFEDKPNPPEENAEAREQEQFEAFLEAEGGNDGQDTANPPQVEEERQEEEQTKEPVAEAEPEGEVDAEAQARIDAATQALRRDNVPADVIANLDREKLIEWGERSKARQAETDRLGNIAHELARQQQSRTQESGQQAEPSVEALGDLGEILKPFAEEYGEEAAKPIAEALKHMGDQFGERIRAIEQEATSAKLSAAREALLNDYPGLKSRETYDAVLGRMRSLASASDAPDRYSNDFSAMMRDAALLEIGPSVTPESKQAFVQEHNNKKGSQVQEQQRIEDTYATMDPKELEFELFKAQENDDQVLANKLLKRLRES